jgi:NADH:ubiquinone oxidoreductase subunit 6 (subunit J)
MFNPIVLELFLIVGAVAVFYVWQMRSLKRDMEITRKKREEAARQQEPEQS